MNPFSIFLSFSLSFIHFLFYIRSDYIHTYQLSPRIDVGLSESGISHPIKPNWGISQPIKRCDLQYQRVAQWAGSLLCAPVGDDGGLLDYDWIEQRYFHHELNGMVHFPWCIGVRLSWQHITGLVMERKNKRKTKKEKQKPNKQKYKVSWPGQKFWVFHGGKIKRQKSTPAKLLH